MHQPSHDVGCQTRGEDAVVTRLSMGPPKTCIIGAGISGIAAMRSLQRADLPFVCFEAGSGTGGLWRIGNDNGMSHIYQTLHTNTSRERTGFSEHPMPDDYPDFPSHRQVLEYLDDFVDRFDLRKNVRFRHRIEHVGRRTDGGFAVTVTRPDGSHQLEAFDVMVVANGHHWDPYFPKPVGAFSGRMIHSSEYERPIDFAGQRVLIVGAGNSACDIASDLAGIADRVAMSTRRGAHIVPKYVLGRPIDQWTSDFMSRLPRFLQRGLFQFLLFLARGSQTSYPFPRPSNPLGTDHPTISSDILNLVGHGRVTVHPDIESVEGNDVRFTDETEESFDVIIMATGFNVVIPFLDDEMVRVADNRVDLYRHVVHPGVDRLYFVGLVQPLGAVAPLVEAQADWIADLITGRCKVPDRDVMWQVIKSERERIDSQYVHTRRHTLEVDLFGYLREIRQERTAK